MGYLAAPSPSATALQESPSVKIGSGSSVCKAITANVLANVPDAVSSAVSAKAVSTEVVSTNSVLESTPNKSSTPSDNRKRQLSSAEKTLPKEKKKDKKEKEKEKKDKKKKQ